MNASPIIWYCVADAGRARILRAAAPRAALAEVETLVGPSYERGRHEPPGRNQESATTARHSFVDAETPARREKREFAQEVAEFLGAAAARNAFGRLVVVAPPKFLGDLRAALDDRAKARLANEVAKDLTHAPLEELAAHFADLPVG